MQDTLYHSLLRVSALALSLVLVFVSGIASSTTATLSRDATVYVASVMSASASIEPTELNQITAALTSKQTELDARERALKEREIAVGLAPGEQSTDVATFILSALVFVLLVLIVLNYILDFMRSVPPKRVEPMMSAR